MNFYRECAEARSEFDSNQTPIQTADPPRRVFNLSGRVLFIYLYRGFAASQGEVAAHPGYSPYYPSGKKSIWDSDIYSVFLLVVA